MTDFKPAEPDFKGLLKELHPDAEWQIEELSGGLVNNTVRARMIAGTSEFETLILKHAPPYVAKVGPGLPLHVDRQVSTYSIPPRQVGLLRRRMRPRESHNPGLEQGDSSEPSAAADVRAVES